MELQADTVKNLFAAGVNQAIISLAQVGNGRLGFKLRLSEFPREAGRRLTVWCLSHGRIHARGNDPSRGRGLTIANIDPA